MRCLTILCAIIVCFMLSGCIQNDTVIHVKPDGSGTIEETVKLSNMLLASFQNMAKGMSEDDVETKDKPEAQDPLQGMMKDAQAREKQYGPDVKFVSATAVKTETMGGYKATYAFKDINTLRINQNPEKKTGMPADGKDQAAKKEEIISFKFIKGPVSKLTVTMPAMDKKNDINKGEEQKAKLDPSAAEMTKMLFKDMSISLVLEIEGSIVETNATYRDNSHLTLLDMNFGKIIQNAKVFERLNAEQPKTIEEMKGMVKEIQGLKIEMNNPIEVAFQ
jgi:hypothetical protein